MERVYQVLLAVGYPEEAVDWLRQHRMLTIIIMAIAAWGLFIGVGWLAWLVLA